MLTPMRVSAALAALLLASSAGAATVRTDRPRLLLTAGNGTGTSLATFKARCTSDAKYQARCQAAITAGSGLFPAIADAAGYVVNGDASKCTAAASAALAAASDAPGQPDAHTAGTRQGRAGSRWKLRLVRR